MLSPLRNRCLFCLLLLTPLACSMWSLADLYERIPLLGPLYRRVQPLAGSLFSKVVLYLYGRRAKVGGGGGAHLNTNTLHAAYHPIDSEKIGSKAMHPMASSSSNARGKKEHSGEKKEL